MADKKYVLLSQQNVKVIDEVAKSLQVSRNRAANMILANQNVRKTVAKMMQLLGSDDNE